MEVVSLREKFSLLNEKMKSSNQKHNEMVSYLNMRCEQISKLLRDSESKYRQLQVTASEMKQQSDLADRAAFQKWFIDYIAQFGGGAELLPSSSSSRKQVQFKLEEEVKDSKDGVRNSSSQGETVRDLVITLLVQWRDQVGFYPRGASGPISKAEQNFLHKITDLVMTAHERSTHCERLCVSSEGKRQDMDRKYKISSSILELTILELYR